MAEPPRDDWAVLGLEPGAGDEAIETAFRRRLALYRSDSLATYSLLAEEERRRLIDSLEAAYRNLRGEGTVAGEEPAPAEVEAAPPPPTELPPDPVAAPGGYLMHHRLKASLSIGEVTARTKIRPVILEALEGERFGELPAPVYVRGFVVLLGRLLALPDPETLAGHYLDRMAAARRGDGGQGDQ